MMVLSGDQTKNAFPEETVDKREDSGTAVEEDFLFDCMICGKNEKNLDDGQEMIQCDLCTSWQHLACEFPPPIEPQEDLKYLCSRCVLNKEQHQVRLSASDKGLPSTACRL